MVFSLFILGNILSLFFNGRKLVLSPEHGVSDLVWIRTGGGGGGIRQNLPAKKETKRSFMSSTAGIPLRMDRCFLCSLEVLHGGREIDLSHGVISIEYHPVFQFWAQCWGSGSACFWAYLIRILHFFHRCDERTEIKHKILAKNNIFRLI